MLMAISTRKTLSGYLQLRVLQDGTRYTTGRRRGLLTPGEICTMEYERQIKQQLPDYTARLRRSNLCTSPTIIFMSTCLWSVIRLVIIVSGLR